LIQRREAIAIVPEFQLSLGRKKMQQKGAPILAPLLDFTRLVLSR
jgi:hypothetical protein